VHTVLTVFGTRPEVIKLAPVIRCLDELQDLITTINVTSAQHTDLLYPFAESFGVRIDHDLKIMQPDQSPHGVCARVLNALEPILLNSKPSVILVQGDTVTALAGALAGFYSRIPVGHVEAGLRTNDPYSPYPEEMNRRLVTRLASYHFAATENNRQTLIAEGVSNDKIFVTGNPVVDSLLEILRHPGKQSDIDQVLAETEGTRRIILTTHRRESLGDVMRQNLAVLRRYVDRHDDCSLIFPVHPNPSVVQAAASVLKDHPRVFLMGPLGYSEFIHLLSRSWLIVSDSGGVQEEAPTLGKPVLILRENTERPEAIEAGVAKLVGGDPQRLAKLLDELTSDASWIASVDQTKNPFGQGDSGRRIVAAIADILGVEFPNVNLESGSAA